MNGFAPLTYSTIIAWASLTGASPSAHEVEALLVLDAVMLHPGTKTDRG